jgi:signal peptidase I
MYNGASLPINKENFVSDVSEFDPTTTPPEPPENWDTPPESPAESIPAAIEPHQPQNSTSEFILEMLQTLVLAGLLIVFFRTFIFQNFVVEGSSMFPTLTQGDRLIVSRLSYYLSEPSRGDIVVFQYPLGPERDFVKRIIGLPGETVAIQNGQVLINGHPLPPENYVQNKATDYHEPVTLGEDEYFVMGDNRTGSSDSRSWGLLQSHFIIGKAWLIYYPFEHFKLQSHAQIEPLP